VKDYLELHGGQDFEIHYRYANLLLVWMVTMIYGTAIPILFPIAFASYWIYYVMDLISIVYYAKKPPAYDNFLNKQFIKMMKWGPIVLLAFGFWQLTNFNLLK